MSRVPRRFDSRLVVGHPEGPYSSLWRIWRTKNEVYIASSKSGGVEKFSFHSGGICRHAFTSEHGTPSALSDRAMKKWKRSDIPVLGTSGASCVMKLGIPTNYLSSVLPPDDKPIIWIEPAPADMATVLTMIFTVEPEEVVRTLTFQGGQTVQVFTRLPNGQAFAVLSHHAAFPGENFAIPASHHDDQDHIVSNNDPNHTGRPIRITIFANPKDGDEQIAWEYGAYKAPKGATDLTGFKRFDRNTVLHWMRAS